MDLNKEHFFNIAKIIDNNFIGSMDTFTHQVSNDFVTLDTNLCDACSIVRLELVGDKFHARRLGPDTNGWEYVQPETAAKINNYLTSLVSTT